MTAPRTAIIRLIVALAVVAVVVMLVGCKSGIRIPFMPGVPAPSQPSNPDDAASWAALIRMGWIAFMPGLIALIVGSLPMMVLFRATFMKLAGTLIPLGIGLVIVPYLLRTYGPAVFWPTAISGAVLVVLSAALVAYHIWKKWKPARQRQKLAKRAKALPKDSQERQDIERQIEIIKTVNGVPA